MGIEKVLLARGGPHLSRMAYGAWRLNDDPQRASLQHVREKIDLCLELGLTTIDHADIYGDYSCEALFGRALAEAPSLRDKMQLVTKAGIKLVSAHRPSHKIKSYDTSAAHLTASLDNSLKQLRTEYVDLFLIHRPDPFMDVQETASALNEMVRSGKAKHIGVSNFTPSQFQLLDARMDKPLVTNQIEMSVLEMAPLEDGVMDQAMRLGFSPMAWSPLGGGLLFDEQNEASVRVRQTLKVLGEKYEADVATMALAWLLAHPARIVPIIGSNSPERIRSLVKAEKVALTRTEWFEVWQASKGREVP